MSAGELLLRLGLAVVAMVIVGATGLALAWAFLAGAAFADNGPGRWIAATVGAVLIAVTLCVVLGIAYLAVTLQIHVGAPPEPAR